MKKIIGVLFIVLIYTTPIYAQNTDEINVDEIFKNFYSIIIPKANDNITDFLSINSNVAIDYSVEILRAKPLSLEAFYVIYFLPRVFNGKKFEEKFLFLKTKHMQNIADLNYEPHEKVVFLLMLLSSSSALSSEENNSNVELAKRVLNNMKNTCENKNYAALANIVLFFDKHEKTNNLEFFKENFPKHPAIPIIELELQSLNYHNDVQACIDELNKLITKHGNVITPLGYKIKIEYLNSLTYCYIKLGDYDNANKCIDLIKNEAPEYRNLKNLLDNVKNE